MSLTESISSLLGKQFSFINLLKEKKLSNKDEAERANDTALLNLKRRKNANPDHLSAIENKWNVFLSSTEGTIYFQTSTTKRNIVSEGLAELNYRLNSLFHCYLLSI
ncbi:hypothetical protein BDF21DRAFT_424954 [Thamnidium elegans]|nr:hypothetical protein BDF21DRAFT_424954 [Thamnidium elegans]